MTQIAGLHGFTGSPAAFDGLRRALDIKLDWFTPWLLGHGAEAQPSLCSGFESEVDRLAAWLDEQGWVQGVLCGYSLGARLALGLLARHPQRFTRAFLMSVHPGLTHLHERDERRRADQRWIECLETEGMDTFCARWAAQPLFHSQHRLPAAVRLEQQRQRRAHDPRGLALALRQCGLAEMPDYHPLVGSLRLPVHLGVGAEDDKFHHLAQRLTRLNPQTTIEIFPDCGHNLLLEAPAQAARWLSARLAPVPSLSR